MATNNLTRRAVIYTRVSTEGQEDNSSLAAQFVACDRKAQEIGAEVVAHLEEVESGGLYLARPKIQRALELIESGMANTLIVMRMDRGGRDVDNLRDIRRRVHAAGGELVFADGLQFDKTPISNFLFTNLAGVAELERELIVDRLQKGRLAALEKGEAVFGSLSPFGYHLATKEDVIRGLYPKDKRFYLVPEQAQIVEKIYLMLDGQIPLSSGLAPSYRGVMMELQAQGIAPPKNRAASARTGAGANSLRGVASWCPSTIRAIVTNPIHKGTPAFRKSKSRRDESRFSDGKSIHILEKRDKDEWIYLQCQPIVSPELWERVNAKMQDRAANSGSPTNRYLLTGLLRCPICGFHMTGCSTSKNYTVKSGEERRSHQRTYRCRDSLSRRCTMNPLQCAKYEEMVIEAVLQVADNPRRLKRVYQDYIKQETLKRQESRKTGERVKSKNWQKELSEITQREAAAAQAKIEAMLRRSSTDVFDTMLDELSARRKWLEAQLATVQPETELKESAITEWVEFLHQQSTLLQSVLMDKSGATNEMQKNLLLRKIIARIDVTDASQDRSQGKWEGVKVRFQPFAGNQSIVAHHDGKAVTEQIMEHVD